MKSSLPRLRLQAGFLAVTAAAEFLIGLVISWMGFLIAISGTNLAERVYDLPDSNLLSWVCSEDIAPWIGLVFFPLVWILLFAVLLGILISTRRQPTLHINCIWAIFLAVLFPVFSVICGITEIFSLGWICVLAFWALHVLIVRILWEYHKAIRQEKQRLKNPEIPTEPAGK